MVRKTVDNNGWTQLLSEESGEQFVTVDVDDQTVYLARSLGEPAEAEAGIKARSGENTVFRTVAGKGVWARSTSSTDASVRIVPGYRKDSDGRGTVNADLVGEPPVDVTDEAGRVVGKVRLEDENNTLIKDSNPLPVDATVSGLPNAPGTLTDNITGDGTLTSTAVPDGREVLFRADPDNAATVNVDGHPLAAGQGVTLAVDNFDAVGITMDDQTDTIHAIVEDS
jgi:hypothetical protein